MNDGLVWFYTVLGVTVVVGVALGIGAAMQFDTRPKEDAFSLLAQQFRETLRRIQAAIRLKFE